MDWKTIAFGKWNWMRPLKSVAIVYFSLALVALLGCNTLLFQPPVPRYTAESSHIVILHGGDRDGRLACFYRSPPRDDAPLLLWSHGNAEDIGTMGPLLNELHAAGFGILAYDYPGYGHSDGSPNERSCYRAIERAWEFATDENAIPANRILIVGQSVGSGPATWLADREDAAGLVLISPFLSAYRTMTHVPLFPGDRFKNINRIRSIREPLLVIHGAEDEVISYSHGRKLYDRHPGPKEFLTIEGAGHNTIWQLGLRDITTATEEFYHKHR